MSDLNDKVNKLIDKAVSASKSEDALRFSQAALNAAHTKHALDTLYPPKQS
jgi:hypothetical protein